MWDKKQQKMKMKPTNMMIDWDLQLVVIAQLIL
jgi:hypothetical protein